MQLIHSFHEMKEGIFLMNTSVNVQCTLFPTRFTVLWPCFGNSELRNVWELRDEKAGGDLMESSVTSCTASCLPPCAVVSAEGTSAECEEQRLLLRETLIGLMSVKLTGPLRHPLLLPGFQ